MRADRLIAMMLILQEKGKTTTQSLADTLEVSRRTILRDIDALSGAGVPLYTDAGHGGGVTLDENYRVKLTGLQESEVRALFLTTIGNAQLLDDIGLGDAAKHTAKKLFATLPAPHQQAADFARQRIYIDPVWWWHGSQSLAFIDELYQAVYENRRLQVHYEKRDGEFTTYTLEAYGLVAKASMWYLVARRDDQFRTYRVSRFREVKLLEEQFERQPEFDLVSHWQQHAENFVSTLTQYTFTLQVHERKLNFLKWYTPGKWKIIDLPSAFGWFVAEFELESIEPAKMLAFGLGLDAVVIAPDELRVAVCQQSLEIAEVYAADGNENL